MRTGDIPGVTAGKSILKLAAKSDLGVLGRAAKLALNDNEPQTIARLFSIDKRHLEVVIIPFSPDGGLPDHLLVQISEAKVVKVFAAQPVSFDAKTEPPVSYKPGSTTDQVLMVAPVALKKPETPEPSRAPSAQTAATSPPPPAARKKSPRGLLKSGTPKRKATPPRIRPVKRAESNAPTAVKPMAPKPCKPSGDVALSAETPPTGPLRETLPLPKMPVAHDVILIADASLMPIAKALVGVLTPTVKTKALPLGKFVSIFEGRAGANAPPEELETQLDPATRLVFLGNSAYASYVREHSLRAGRTGSAGWAISGQTVRCSTIWTQSIPKHNIGDLIADAQFDIGQLCYLAVPKKRNGRRQTVNKGLALAGLFLEDPATIVPHRTPRGEAQHTLVLLAVARWLKEGFEVFLTP